MLDLPIIAPSPLMASASLSIADEGRRSNIYSANGESTLLYQENCNHLGHFYIRSLHPFLSLQLTLFRVDAV
jgi:hypothetical protein